MSQPQLLSRHEDGAELAMALWRFGSPLLALSSAPHGGGWGERHWILAAQVASDYSRADPSDHLAELARGLELDGPGVGMLTAVDVRLVAVEFDAKTLRVIAEADGTVRVAVTKLPER